MLMPLIQDQRGPLSVAEACQALGLDPATYHRWKRPPRAPKARTSPRALTAQERQPVEDVYSRYVVGWMVAPREYAPLACQLVSQTAQRQAIRPGQLTLHADRGSVMTSDPLTKQLIELGIRQTHSRPRISDDNPFSESLFKTLKYHLGYPGRFKECDEARAWCATFFAWYNAEHKPWQLRRLPLR